MSNMIHMQNHYTLGIRPDITARMLSGLQRAPRTKFRVGVRGLGASPTVTNIQGTDATAAQFQAQLQQSAVDLQSLADAAASNATVAASLQAPLAAAQAQYTALANAFSAWLTSWSTIIAAVTMPFSPVNGVALAQQLASYVSQLEVLQGSIAGMKSQLAGIATQNVNITQGSATDSEALAAAAYNNGDSATGDYYSNLADEEEQTALAQGNNLNPPPPNPSTNFEAWLENNAIWIAVAAGVIFIAPEVIKKI
jgi:hypothetical protein